MTIKYGFTTLLSAALLITAGCASQSQPGAEFGSTVRGVMQNQVYDPVAAVYPAEEAVTGGNGDRLEKVVEMHSGSVSNPQGVQRPLNVGVDSR